MKAFLAETLGKNQNNQAFYRVFFLTALMLSAVFVFYPVLSAGFINYDDNVMVLGNLKITSFSLQHVKSLLFESHFRLYHPIVNLSFALEYMLFGQDPYFYHADNLILHLLNVILVFFIFFTLTKRNFFTAFITAAVFACHPLSVEAVAWISARKDVLYAFFFLSSVYAYLRRKKTYYALSLVLFLFACLSKPMAVTLPVILILADWFEGEKMNFRICVKYVPYFALAFLFSVATYVMYYSAGEKDAIKFTLLLKNFISAHFNVVFYLVKFVWPSKLAIIYPDFFSVSGGSTGYLPLFAKLSPVFVWSLFALAVCSLKYTKKIFFGGLFFAITVLPVINILPAGPVSVADRYVYVSLIGLSFIAASIVSLLCRFKAAVFIFAAVFCLMCFTANIQAKKWNNSFSVFDNQIKNYPASSAMAYVLRYYETYNKKDLYEAYRLSPDHSTVVFSFGQERCKEGRYEDALNFYKRVNRDDPGKAAAFVNSMKIYNELGDEEKFFKTFKESVDFLPSERLFTVYMYMAVYYAGKEEYEEAFKNADIAKRIFPKDQNTYLLKGAVYEKQDNFNAALNEYGDALLNCGATYEILEAIGILYFKNSNFDASRNFFKQALEKNPSSFETYDFLGNIEAAKGDYKKALTNYSMALTIKNDFAQSYFHRAALYMKYGRYDKAERDAGKAKNAGFEIPEDFYYDLKFLKGTNGKV